MLGFPMVTETSLGQSAKQRSGSFVRDRGTKTVERQAQPLNADSPICASLETRGEETMKSLRQSRKQDWPREWIDLGRKIEVRQEHSQKAESEIEGILAFASKATKSRVEHL
jgi:hypothetical protein